MRTLFRFGSTLLFIILVCSEAKAGPPKCKKVEGDATSANNSDYNDRKILCTPDGELIAYCPPGPRDFMKIEGSLSLDSKSVFSAEIRGPRPILCPLLGSTETVSLGGELEIKLMSGYKPDKDEEIVIIRAKKIEGEFSSGELGVAEPSGAFDIVYGPNYVSLIRYNKSANGNNKPAVGDRAKKPKIKPGN